jgi:hypothetical protein
MLNVGDRVRETATGLTGRVIRIFCIGMQGNLVVVRLDHEHPLWGMVMSAWEGELEVIERAKSGENA